MAQKRIQPQQGVMHSSSNTKGNKKKPARRKAPFVLAGFAIVFLTAAIFIANNYSKELEYRRMISDAVNRDVFYEGIVVDGINLGGLSVEAARAKLTAREQEIIGRVNLKAQYESQEFPITSEDVGFTFNTDEVLKKAWDVGRSGEVEQRYVEIQRVASQGVSLSLASSFDESRLRMAAARIAGQINVGGFNAEVQGFDYATKTFTISEESSGYSADEASLADAIVKAVTDGNLNAVISIQVNRIEPTVTKAQLAAKMGQLGKTFKTETTKVSARNNNIGLASAAVTEHGMIMPGEEFSFNTATGPRDAAQGYQEAGAYRNGETVPELGGGVCQVSTTLYNAVVRSGLQVTERNHHSMTVSYVPFGHDAAVDHTTKKDLRFINNTDQPVWVIVAFNLETRVLTAEVYGERILESGVTYDLDTTVTETIPKLDVIWTLDPSLEPGSEKRTDSGKEGYRIETYLVKNKDGVQQSRELLFKSYYRASPPRYAYNPSALYDPSKQANAADPAASPAN